MRWTALFITIFLGFLVKCSSPSARFETENRASNPLNEGLSSLQCDLWRDPDGIPHVRGGSDRAAIACTGYLHGRDRLFQMDYLRRAQQGRLSEILGTSHLKDDFFLRLLGLAEKAEEIFKEMAPETKDFLWAYTYGVNRGMADSMRKGNYEIEEIAYDPEPWRPQDSVGILLLESLFETKATFTTDFTEDAWKKAWGEKAASLMTQDGLPWDNSILKPGEFKASAGSASVITPNDESLRGSNNWALSSQWSKSGKAWFANDPHVSLQYPSFWYWVHLQGDEMDVAGATVPGMPLVVSGLNHYVAWGLTDALLKVADVIAIPESEAKDFVSIRPTIWLRTGPIQIPFFLKSFRRSKEGFPLLPLDAPDGKVYLLRWSGLLLTGKHLSAFPKLAKAKNVEEMDSLLAQLRLPTFSYVFADTHGGIGYRAIGLLPKNTDPTPLGVREGSLEGARKYSFFTPEESPHLLNPHRGYLVTANNRVWPSKNAQQSGRAYASSFRSYRIEEMIRSTHAHNLETLQRIQCDSQFTDAKFLTPKIIAYLKTYPLTDPNLENALKILATWDFQSSPECRACGIYTRWMERLKERWTINHPGFYRLMEEKPDSARQTEMIHELSGALKDIHGATWGDLHRAYFEHISGGNEFTSEDWITTPGNGYSVNVGGAKWKEDYYLHYSGASHRLIVEMTSPPRAYLSWEGAAEDTESRSLNKAGSSWQRWSHCAYQPLRFPLDWKAVPKTVIRLSQ